MPVRSANTRQARCSCTSGPAPWNPCPHLGDIDAVVPGPGHGLEPTRRDDARVHIDPGVRVDKGLITFHHERLEERNAPKEQPPGQRTPRAESHNRHAPTWHFAGIRPRRVTKT